MRRGFLRVLDPLLAATVGGDAATFSEPSNMTDPSHVAFGELQSSERERLH